MKAGSIAKISLAALLALSPIAYAGEASSTKSDATSDTGERNVSNTTPTDTVTNEKRNPEASKEQNEFDYVMTKEFFDEIQQYILTPSAHPK